MLNAFPRSLPAFLCALVWTVPAYAITIAFEATDLADVNPGEDLYRYSYTLSDFPYPADFGFSVLFDPNLYDALESLPPSVGSAWDVIAIQPDPGLPDDGFYDAMALVSFPTELTGFAIDFIWLGAGTPGSQPFVVYDDSFATIVSGQTVLVPEPSTLVLLAAGIAGIARLRSYAPRRMDTRSAGL